ncbi:MAG: hypothetical protein CSA62_08300 [Planctomycetota bacterium]|nr:MAG: hypothetical protein CSA62_08300 [Planctomycetota bacterium]
MSQASESRDFAKLRQARFWVQALLLLSILSVPAALSLSLFGGEARRRSALAVRALGLQELSVAPSGSWERSPKAAAAPFEFVPGLPRLR